MPPRIQRWPSGLEGIDGGVAAFGGTEMLVLSSPVGLTVKESAVCGRLKLRRGESAGFALHHAERAKTDSVKVWSQSEIGARFEDDYA